MDCDFAQTIYQLSFFIEAYEQLLAGKKVKVFENARLRIDRDRGMIFFQDHTISVNNLLSGPEQCVDVGALRTRWNMRIIQVRADAALATFGSYGNAGATLLDVFAPGSREAIDWARAGYQAAKTGVNPTLLEGDRMIHHGIELAIRGASLSSGLFTGGAAWVVPIAIGVYRYIRDQVHDKNPQCTFTKPPGF